jgi:hypothetical protein
MYILKKCRILLAILAIVACLVTWYLDIADIVIHCPYCRVQRTMIGALGVLLLLPSFFPTAQRIIALVLGFFGADISGDQMFLSIKAGTFPTTNFWIALCALILIILLLFSMFIKTQRT